MAFEPGKSEVVATCGGKFICVFNLESGDLLCQYQHEEDQQFYCLSWSSLPSGNILASGSDMGEIRLYDIDRDVTFYSWSYKKATPINAAKFHSEEASWLITASQVSGVLRPLVTSSVVMLPLLGRQNLPVGHWRTGPAIQGGEAQLSAVVGLQGQPQQGHLQHGLGVCLTWLRLDHDRRPGRADGLADLHCQCKGAKIPPDFT